MKRQPAVELARQPVVELARGRYGDVAAVVVANPRADVGVDPRVVADCLNSAAAHLDAIGFRLVLVPGDVVVGVRSRRRRRRRGIGAERSSK